MNSWVPQLRSQEAGSGAPRVMLIDDDLRSRYATAEVLRSEGYTVLSASGHESWLALFKTCLSIPATWVSFVAALEPHIVLLDLGLSGGVALPTLGEIRRHPLTKHIPVVVVGNSGRDTTTARSLGAAHFLPTPLSRDGLRPVVELALSESPERPPPLTGDEAPSVWLC